MGFIDLKKHAEENAERIKAETELAQARENLIDAYAKTAVHEVLTAHGYLATDQAIEAFRPLMREALAANLTAREIDQLLLEAIEDALRPEAQDE